MALVLDRGPLRAGVAVLGMRVRARRRGVIVEEHLLSVHDLPSHLTFRTNPDRLEYEWVLSTEEEATWPTTSR